MTAILVLGCCLVASATTPRHAASPNHMTAPIRLIVIGDSLSTGYQTPGNPWTDEAQAMFDASGQDVEIVNAAENGAGYVSRGANGDNFRDEADMVVDARADVVLVFGSDNDLGQTGVARAAASTLARIRSLTPHATVIVVGPPAPPAASPSSLAAIRDDLRTSAQQAGAQFVDALEAKWFQGSDAQFTGPDGEHPNASGALYLADKMVAILAPAVARQTQLSPGAPQAAGPTK
ncbi:MAG: SGNH/GDSL hydrolase family protein [Jatrophihabitans sp.]